MSDNKKYYWIKLHFDFFNLDVIDWLISQKNGCEYIVLYQKLCLLTANSGGRMIQQIGEMIIPYDVNKIARDTKFNIDTVIVALELFKKIGLILQEESGIMFLPRMENMIGEETKWAQKKRLQREKKGHCPPNVSADVPQLVHENEGTLSDKSKSIEIELDIEINKDKDTAKNNSCGDDKKKTFADVLLSNKNYQEHEGFKKMIDNFIEHRKNIKTKFTPYALDLFFEKLESLTPDIEEQIALIKTAIVSGWKTVYGSDNNGAGRLQSGVRQNAVPKPGYQPSKQNWANDKW